MVQSFHKHRLMEFMIITQPGYNTQPLDISNNTAKLHNTDGTNDAQLISPNYLKRMNSSNTTSNNDIENNNQKCSTITNPTNNTNSNLTDDQKTLEAFTQTLASNNQLKTQTS